MRRQSQCDFRILAASAQLSHRAAHQRFHHLTLALTNYSLSQQQANWPFTLFKMPSGTQLGRVRAYWLGSVVCMGGFLFGYDSGMCVSPTPGSRCPAELRRLTLFPDAAVSAEF
jgi:hypothetical protein